MAYGLRYYAEARDIFEVIYRIEILENDYSGAGVLLSLGSSPILRQDNSKEGIAGTSLELLLQEDIEGRLKTLYTTDNRKFKVILYKGGTIIWQGFVLPERYSEDYIAPPYDVAISATDGLGVLKNIDYPASDNRATLLQIIKECLQAAGIELDIEVQSGITLENQSVTESIIKHLYINKESFVEMNCYEVLSDVMRSLNASITQRANKWLISRQNDANVSTIIYDFTTLNRKGAASLTIGQIGQMNTNELFPIGSLRMEINPASKDAQISYAFSLRESMLRNPNCLPDVPGWSKSNSVQEPRMVLNPSTGGYRVLDYYSIPSTVRGSGNPFQNILQQLQIEQDDNAEYAFDLLFKTDGEAVQSFEVQISITPTSGAKRYLSESGWVSSESSLTYNGSSNRLDPTAMGRPGIIPKDTFDKTTVQFSGFPISGVLEIKISNTDYHQQGGQADWLYIGGAFLYSNSLPAGLTTHAVINPQASQSSEEVVLKFGDATEHANSDKLQNNYFTLQNGANTIGLEWTRDGVDYSSFYELMIHDICLSVGLARYQLSGSVSGNNPLRLCYSDRFSGKLFALQTYQYNLLENEVSLSLQEIPQGAVEITTSDIQETTSSGGSSGAGSGGSGGSGGGLFHPLGGSDGIDLVARKLTMQVLVVPKITPPVDRLESGESALWLGDIGFDVTPPSPGGSNVVWTTGTTDYFGLSVDSVVKNVSLSGHKHIMSDVTGLQSALDEIIASIGQANINIGAVNILDNSNTFNSSLYQTYQGAVATFTPNQTVAEWGATDATRIQVAGGTNIIKLIRVVLNPSELNQDYTNSIYIKNNGATPVIFRTNIPAIPNLSNTITIPTGGMGRFIVNGRGNGTSQLHIQLVTVNAADSIDIIVWRAQVERANVSSAWRLSQSDLDNKYHPRLGLSTLDFTAKKVTSSTLVLPTVTPTGLIAGEPAIWSGDIGFDVTPPSPGGSNVAWTTGTTDYFGLSVDNTAKNISLYGHKHAISDVTNLQASLNNKVDVVVGKGLSTNDYTTAEKTKLAGIEAGANNYVHPSATARQIGGARHFLTGLTVSNLGHVTAATSAAMVKADIEALLTGSIASHYHSLLNMPSVSSENDAIPDANLFEVFRSSQSSAVGGDGYIMSLRWSSGQLTTQIYADLDATYNMSIRHRGSDGAWLSWMRLITEANYAAILGNIYHPRLGSSSLDFTGLTISGATGSFGRLEIPTTAPVSPVAGKSYIWIA